jgi:deoxyribose-phosphate aldolase
MVMNVGLLKAGEEGLVAEDIAAVVKAAAPAVVKVIIEAALLEDREKVAACKLAMGAGASFVKTSTGFGPPGANPEDVRIMRGAVGPDFGVKASAGIRTAAFALELVEAGANRIGTSAGVQIMEEWRAMKG